MRRLFALLFLPACLTRPAPYESPPLPTPTQKPTAEARTEAPAPTATATAQALPEPPPKDGMPVATRGVLRREQADAILKLGDPPVVKLLEAGAEPRADLSFDLKAKEKQSTDMRMSIAMQVSQPGNASPAARLPEVSILLDLANGSRNKEGDVEVTGTVAKIAVIPQSDAEANAAKDIASALEPTKGLKVTYVVSSKGRARNLKVDAGKIPPRARQLVEQLKQSFEAMSTPLPVEPIGVGARWQVINRIQSGADVLQFTTYTLRAADKGKLELESEVVQYAAGPSFTPEGMSAPVQINEFMSRGKGASTVLLTKVAPETSAAALKGRILMTVPQGGETLVDTEVGVRFIKPGSAPAPAPAAKPKKP